MGSSGVVGGEAIVRAGKLLVGGAKLGYAAGAEPGAARERRQKGRQRETTENKTAAILAQGKARLAPPKKNPP